MFTLSHDAIIGHAALVTITLTAILLPYLSVKSLQLIWRSGTRRWNLRVPDSQVSCRDLTIWLIGYQDSSPSNGCQATCPVCHYNDVIMSMMASQITSDCIVCWTVCSGADQRKHQSCASLASVRGIHRWLVNSPHKEPVMRKIFTFDNVIMVPGIGHMDKKGWFIDMYIPIWEIWTFIRGQLKNLKRTENSFVTSE